MCFLATYDCAKNRKKHCALKMSSKSSWLMVTSHCCQGCQEQDQRSKEDIGRELNKIETKEEIKGKRERRQKRSCHPVSVILNHQGRGF